MCGGHGNPNYPQSALVCPETPAEGIIDLRDFHQWSGRRYVAVFVILMALWQTLSLALPCDFRELPEQNLPVVPVVLVSIAAALFLTPRVRAAALVCLAGLWGLRFSELPQAVPIDGIGRMASPGGSHAVA